MKILVTGGCGFIGSNFIRHLIRNEIEVVNLDKLTYAGNPENLRDISGTPLYTFVKGNICNYHLVSELFDTFNFDAVVHFAAESHVDKSIDDPFVFSKTNYMGTHTLLEGARSKWKDYSSKTFIHVSTDEVYGSLSKGFFVEETPYAPNSPYSASKASSDMIARAYYKTYGLPVVITNCSNNYGPFQYPEKLIPLMITNALENKELPVYGKGENIRDWIYVEDHCKGIEQVLKKGIPGEKYNFGGDAPVTNIFVVEQILEILGKPDDMITFVKDRPGHDLRYAIDSSKAKRSLKWSPETKFIEGLQKAVQWYVDNENWWKVLKHGSA